MMVADFRPIPQEVLERQRMSMLQSNSGVSDLISQLSAANPELQKKLTDALAKAIESAIRQAISQSSGSDVMQSAAQAIDSVVSVALDKALQSGKDAVALGTVSALPRAIDKAVSDLQKSGQISQSVADQLRDISQRISRAVADSSESAISSAVQSVAVDELPEEEFRKLMDAISKMDLKQHGVGVGEGPGLLSGFVARVMLSGRTRNYIRERIRDLRTAAHYRQMTWPKGKRLDVRATMRKYMRTGMPFPAVYKTQVVRPKTKEDVIFVVDVSGSMSAAYPVIYTISKAMQDIGLNTTVYAFDTQVVTAKDVDEIFAKVGGGGTEAAPAIQAVIRDRGDTLKETSTVVYTDLEFGGSDFDDFTKGLEEARNRGSKVSVWVYDCSVVQEEVNQLERKGFMVVCDVKTLDDMLSALQRMKKELIRRA